MKFSIFLTYSDGSEFGFDVTPHETKPYAILADIEMITRGTLMVTSAIKATAYNEEGFDVCSYIK